MVEALTEAQLKAQKNVDVCQRLTKSYGARTVIFSYLPTLEQIGLQQLNKWWYNFAVGQVQTVFKLSREDIVAVKDFIGLTFVDANTCIRKEERYYTDTEA